MAPILEIKGLSKQFGGLRAVSDFDLTLQEGELAGLIGPNGAGKTTVFNLVTGVYPVS
ncbi:MAG TPA: ATP-binding cassette domain-containing protein, partial [Anaerolineae bacterium]|nr:ATP-binding cassette domain-containing protein [Anaerolineae bacterium]